MPTFPESSLMQPNTSVGSAPNHPVPDCTLFDALRSRRSRRFGVGMEIPSGPFKHKSSHAPFALSEAEEATLAFAGCGVSGYALGDLSYGAGEGGNMLHGLLGRTIGASDAVNSVSLIVLNDEGPYFVRRPEDFSAADVVDLIHLARQGRFEEIYTRSRIKIMNERAAPPLEPAYNFDINKWSLYAPGSTYFLPVSELTALYINALLAAFDESMANFVLDERAGYAPAGLARFAKSKGGHLEDDPRANRILTINFVETVVQEFVAVQQGMIAQNLGLAAEAMGLGGFPNYANHPYIWFQALGFRMGEMPSSRFFAMNPVASFALKVLGKDQAIKYPLGLARDNELLLKPYCPPYFDNMRSAVLAIVEKKYGANGAFRGGASASNWRDPQAASAQIPAPSDRAVEATIAYCEYIYSRYGRFPAISAPFRTTVGFQVTHPDAEFYDRFYRPEALTDAHRNHLAKWHPGNS